MGMIVIFNAVSQQRSAETENSVTLTSRSIWEGIQNQIAPYFLR